MPKYYTLNFEESNVPSIDRVDYMGYKFEEVIDKDAVRTLREAKRVHRKNLLKMIAACQKELENIKNLTPDNVNRARIW